MQVLEKIGAQVRQAGDGPQALEEVRPLAAHLRRLGQRYDFKTIAAVLKDVQSSEEE